MMLLLAFIACKEAPDEIALLQEQLNNIETTSDETFGHIVEFRTLKHLEKVIFHNTKDQKAVNLIANFEALDDKNTQYLNEKYDSHKLLDMEGKERERVAELIKTDSFSQQLRIQIQSAKMEKQEYLTKTFEDYARLKLRLKIGRKSKKLRKRQLQ